MLWDLTERDARDIGCRTFDRSTDVARQGRGGTTHVVARHFERRPDPVEAARKPGQRTIAAVGDACDDRGDAPSEAAITSAIACQHTRERPPIGSLDDSHSTILLSGYSTMPCACAALSRGIRSRTVFSS